MRMYSRLARWLAAPAYSADDQPCMSSLVCHSPPLQNGPSKCLGTRLRCEECHIVGVYCIVVDEHSIEHTWTRRSFHNHLPALPFCLQITSDMHRPQA